MPSSGAKHDPFAFVEQPDAHYTAHVAAWTREERRLYGGDDVLTELTRFTGEDDSSFDLRQRTARYLNFPDVHVSILAGHLRRALPLPMFGAMGDVHDRVEIKTPTLAELFWYNCDGIGQDGMQFPAWLDGIVKRACATGYRWLMVEMPSAATLASIRGVGRRDPNAARLTSEDVQGGFRPWLVERSPLAAPRRRITNGVLDYIVFTVPLPATQEVDASGAVSEPEAPGFYVLVRDGFTGLGDYFKAGGWWLIDAEHNVVDQGNWSATNGQIPVVRAVAEYSQGTHALPALARSLTMELGQIAVDVMNARSEQRYNAREAAKSINWLLGADPTAQSKAAAQVLAGSILVAVPAVGTPDGGYAIPQMWNSSAAALDTQVYSNIIAEALAEAREIMVKQVTSEPGSSGESKVAGFEEANSPLLARLATATETWVNSVLYFFALRAGVRPDASITMPRNFNLRQVIDDVDEMLDSMRRASVTSPTWVRELLTRKGDQLGLIPDEFRETILAELAEAASARQVEQTQLAAMYRSVATAPAPRGNGQPSGRLRGAMSDAGADTEGEE